VAPRAERRLGIGQGPGETKRRELAAGSVARLGRGLAIREPLLQEGSAERDRKADSNRRERAGAARRAACPFRHRARLLTSRRLRVRALERAFPAGTRIEFRITKPSRIGKYTRVVIGAGRAPARRDRCLMPDRRRPVACEPTPPGQR
jgi:hypothetical protein